MKLTPNASLPAIALTSASLVLAGVLALGATPRAQDRSDRRPAATTASGQRPTASVTPERAVLNKYCIGCHNDKLKTAGLMLDAANIDDVRLSPETWEKVVRKVRSRAMPPAGMPRLDSPAMTTWVAGLEASLDRAASAKPNPGRTAPVHRLNRAEYTNAVRDLLALEIDGRAFLPADDSGYGFDNIGDVLSISPGLLERYMLAAAKVSRLAIGDPAARPTTATYRSSPLLCGSSPTFDDVSPSPRKVAGGSHFGNGFSPWHRGRGSASAGGRQAPGPAGDPSAPATARRPKHSAG